MNKEFIPYEQALALKELGFDEPCLGAWAEHGFMTPNDVSSLQDDVIVEDIENTQDKGMCLAPLYQQAFRWFREKYDLFGVVEGKGYDHKRYYVYSINGKWHPSQPGLDTYEEAELACLNKLIQIVKL